MERLLQNVNQVKQILQGNLKLREDNLELQRQLSQVRTDMSHIQLENEELKEKVQILAHLAPSTATAVGAADPEAVIPPFAGTTSSSMASTAIRFNPRSTAATPESKTSQGRLDLANEFLQLKKDKGALERRVEDLERQNIHIRAASHTSDSRRPVPPDASGTDDFEPVRSVMNGAETFYRVTHNYSQMRQTRQKQGGRCLSQMTRTTRAPKSSYAKMRRGFPSATETPMKTSATQRLRAQILGSRRLRNNESPQLQIQPAQTRMAAGQSETRRRYPMEDQEIALPDKDESREESFWKFEIQRADRFNGGDIVVPFLK